MRKIIIVIFILIFFTVGCTTKQKFNVPYQKTVKIISQLYDEDTIRELNRDRTANVLDNVLGIPFEKISISKIESKINKEFIIDINAIYSKPWSMHTTITIYNFKAGETEVKIRSLDNGQSLFRNVRDKDYEAKRMKEIEKQIENNT